MGRSLAAAGDLGIISIRCGDFSRCSVHESAPKNRSACAKPRSNTFCRFPGKLPSSVSGTAKSPQSHFDDPLGPCSRPPHNPAIFPPPSLLDNKAPGGRDGRERTMAQRITKIAGIAGRGSGFRGRGSGGPQGPDEGALRRPVDDGERGAARGQDPRRPAEGARRRRRTAWARSPSGSAEPPGRRSSSPPSTATGTWSAASRPKAI